MLLQSPESLVNSGQLPGALEEVKARVRNNPAEPEARIALFQLYCIFGDWAKSRSQLMVLKDLGEECERFALTLLPVLDAEEQRTGVLIGKQSPIIFGEPAEWISWLVEAFRLFANGETAHAAALRDKAFEAAPAIPGTLNGASFDWIADADSRFGPVLEMIMDGVYRWVPLMHISSIRCEAPKDLRNLVWFPAHFTWTNGGQAHALIPARYPGIQATDDATILLGRQTEWCDHPNNFAVGRGQRFLATPDTEFALLELRECHMAPAGDRHE